MDFELRKPCREMSWDAWESVHGGSRKWFPEHHQRSRYLRIGKVSFTAVAGSHVRSDCRLPYHPPDVAISDCSLLVDVVVTHGKPC
jgi:hypothetical protein